MVNLLNINIKLSKNLKQKPVNEKELGFGSIFTDHMFIMNYSRELGWHDPRIVPYAPISLDPAAICLHYSQEVFEGLKAYRSEDGRILLFRPEKNMERLNRSNERMCIPKIDEEFCVNAIKELVRIDKDWVPSSKGTSLYIRPFIIGIDAKLGVHTADKLMFIVICSPVGAYYKEGLNPVKIYVEDNYVRAVKGGTGFAKTGGNYSASLKAQVEANDKGCTQVLWLDGKEHKYIEEVGTMNVFFVIGNKIITPSLDGSILPGITRLSVIELLKDKGYIVEERKISIDELMSEHKKGNLKEAFGTGTAAVISPIGMLKYKNETICINDGKIGNISQNLYDEITDIQWGRINDRFNWTTQL